MQKTISGIIILLVIVAAAVCGIIFVNYHRTFVVLNGPAMEPTIKSGQEVRVNKYAKNQLPQRGDIVEFTSSNKLIKKYETSTNIIERVIAIPGDRLTISNNKVMVSDAQYPNGFDPDASYLSPNVVTTVSVNLTLGPGMYYVMGDNRPDSLDSRVIGPVPLSNIIGKVTTKLPFFLSKK